MTKHNDIDLYNDVEKIKEALREATYDVKGKAAELLEDSMDSVKEQTGEVKAKIGKYTAKKPFQALGLTLLAGVAIGYLLRK